MTCCASDLRDFPALSSSALNAANLSLPATGTSYASQAGTASQVAAGNVSTNGNGVSAGFGPDDFPALGQAQAQDGHSVTPHGVSSISGSSQELSSQHRQSILGSLPTSQQRATPSSEAQQKVHSSYHRIAYKLIFGLSSNSPRNTNCSKTFLRKMSKLRRHCYLLGNTRPGAMLKLRNL